MQATLKTPLAVTALLLGLTLASDALALRCGNKLVRDGMHEAEVLAICGEPATRRDIGRTYRNPDLYVREGGRLYPADRVFIPGFLSTEVVVTEYVYNFGPRRLMQRMIFEGGVLVTVESLGHGYLEK